MTEFSTISALIAVLFLLGSAGGIVYLIYQNSKDIDLSSFGSQIVEMTYEEMINEEPFR